MSSFFQVLSYCLYSYSHVLCSNEMPLFFAQRLGQPNNAHKGCDHTHTGHEAQTPGPEREAGALHSGAEDAVHPRGCEWTSVFIISTEPSWFKSQVALQ